MAKFETGIGWPGWETVRLIGRGSFGAVYEIRREVFGDTERCALKHISIPQSDSEVREMRGEGQDEQSISLSFSEQAREVASEYKLMMRLNDCPNVVRCYDVVYNPKGGGVGWDILIRMELLTPLIDLLGQQQGLPEEEILRLGRDLAQALIACERLHILHRDIKPQNIFVDGDGDYKLGDFGIARISEKTGSATARIGTYTYMAPEVYKGEHYGAQADIYSLGMVLYWLLNERRGPFVVMNTPREKAAALDRRMRGEPIPAPAHGSPWLQRIALKACAYDPRDRYQTAEELLRDLENSEFGARNEANSEFGVRNSEWGSDGRAPAPVGATFGRPPVPETRDQDRRGDPCGRPFPADEDATAGGSRTTPEQRTFADRDATTGVFRKTGAKPAPGPVGATGGPSPVASTGQGAPEAPTPGGERQEPAANAKKKKLLPILIGAAAAVLALAILLILKTTQSKRQTAAYENAVSLQEAGRYEEAAAAFEALGDYEDSAERLTVARYGQALSLLESGQYEEAAAIFEVLGDYRDSADAASYARAEALAAEGKIYEAARAFYAIKGYKDSWERCFTLWGQITPRETLSAGENHTVGLRTDGTVLAVGRNDYNMCEVSGWTDVVAVSAGRFHTVGLRANGTVLAVGYHGDGQCDVSGWTDIVAVSAGTRLTAGLRADGTVVATRFTGNPERDHGQFEVSGWTDVIAISAGEYHTVGLRADGTVLATTYTGDQEKNSGQCEVSGWTEVIAISATAYHTVGLRADGTVLAVGKNTDGRCDVSSWTDVIAVSAGSWHTVGLRADGTVLAVGYYSNGQCEVSGWTDVVAISAGQTHTVGLRADGTVLVAGDNEYGQCDVSGWRDIALPVKRSTG